MANEARLTDSLEPSTTRNGTGSAKSILETKKSHRKFICVTPKHITIPKVTPPKTLISKEPKKVTFSTKTDPLPRKMMIKPPAFQKPEPQSIKRVTPPTGNKQPAKKSIIAVLRERKNPTMIEPKSTSAPRSNVKLFPLASMNATQYVSTESTQEKAPVERDYSNLRFETWDEEFLTQFKGRTPVSDFDAVINKIIVEFTGDERINSNLARMALGYDKADEGSFEPTAKKINLVALMKEAIKVLEDPLTNRVEWRADFENALLDKDIPWHRIMAMIKEYQQRTNSNYFIASITNSDNQETCSKV